MRFYDIEENGCFDNGYFKGVNSIDILNLVNVINQYQITCFKEDQRKVVEF